MPDEEPEKDDDSKSSDPYRNGTCEKINVSLDDRVGNPLANGLRKCKRKRVESYANSVGNPLATSTHWWDD